MLSDLMSVLDSGNRDRVIPSTRETLWFRPTFQPCDLFSAVAATRSLALFVVQPPLLRRSVVRPLKLRACFSPTYRLPLISRKSIKVACPKNQVSIIASSTISPNLLASAVALKTSVAYVHQIKFDPLKYLPKQESSVVMTEDIEQ